MSGAEGSQTFLGPHEGRELELMRNGKKHLSKFSIEGDLEPYFPEQEFDLLVEEGFLIKDERLEPQTAPDGQEVTIRNILYATAAEAWRIQAMRLVEDIYRTSVPGWRPDLERVIGSLLGYERQDVELFIEGLSVRKS
jgi:hypothetical protein